MNKKIIILTICLLLLAGCTKKDLTNTNKKNSTSNNLITEKEEKLSGSEEDLTNYIDNVEGKVEDLSNKDNLTEEDKSTLKNTFKTLTDFIFYGGTIKGKTFNELSDSSKAKVLSTFGNIDEKIETKVPNYKETIKDKSKKAYTKVAEEAKSLKETILDKYKNYVGDNAYNDTNETYEDDKNNFKETTKPYVDEAKKAATKAKDKIKNWYNDWKESR